MVGSLRTLLLAAVASASFASAAQADVVISDGNIPGDTDNVLFGAGQSCTGATGPATTVQGCLNQDRDQLVNLTSNENLQITFTAPGGQGQANLVATDGSFDELLIELDGDETFDYLIFNIDVLDDAGDGTVTFTAFLEGEDPFTSEPFAVSANGQNFFTVQAINDELLTGFLIEADVPITFANVNQIRIGPGDGGGGGLPVPEPGAIGLLGLGLLTLGYVRRRKAI